MVGGLAKGCGGLQEQSRRSNPPVLVGQVATQTRQVQRCTGMHPTGSWHPFVHLRAPARDPGFQSTELARQLSETFHSLRLAQRFFRLVKFCKRWTSMMAVRLQRCKEHLLLKEHQAGMICLIAGTAATDSCQSGAVAMCTQTAKPGCSSTALTGSMSCKPENMRQP